MTHGIATAGGGHGWETGVVSALSDPAVGFTVVRRCADTADLLAVAATGQISACLLTADLRGFDSETAHRLAGFGVAVIAVHRAGDTRRVTSLDRIGVFAAIPDDVSPAVMLAALRRSIHSEEDTPSDRGPGKDAIATGAARPDASQGAAAGLDRSASPAADVAAAGHRADDHSSPDVARTDAKAPGAAEVDLQAPHAALTDAPRPVAPSPRTRRRHVLHREKRRDRAPQRYDGVSAPAQPQPGRVVAVWGPHGSPGRTTVAMGLADRAATRRGMATLLIDADVYGGVLASAFGLLDESAGLAGACRLATNGRLTESELAELCWRIDDRRTLLTGIARSDRWPELRPSTIPAILTLARQLADLVVVDCSALLERDEEITFDTMAPRRNGATLAVLQAADRVLAVGSGDPPGIERLARGYVELADAIDDAQPSIVINRVRSTAASESELRDAVQRFCGAAPVAFLPEDRAACDRAWLRGTTVSEAAPKSSLVAAFDGVLEAVTTLRRP